MADTGVKPKPRKRTAMEVLARVTQPKVAIALALGFSSGLPFLLTGNTFGFWLRDAGTTLTAIGFISWVGLAYSFKFIWAPVVDRVDLPLLGRLGRRRGWMVFCQLLVAAALVGMAAVGTSAGLTAIGAFALLVAFASSTQDVAIDAWRIESANDSDELGLLTSAYQLGYRIALIVTDAAIIAAAARLGWPVSYVLMAACMSAGLIAALFAPEPARAEVVLQSQAPLWTPRGFADAVIGPFVDFFTTHKWAGLVVLLTIALYRLPDFVMGPMYNPYYHDLGITKDMVAGVRGSVGLAATIAGIAASGVSAVRLGAFPTLMLGLVLEGFGTAAFALLAMHHDLATFSAIMTLDNFAQAFAGVALVTYMSGLTSLGYTATQYALLSSTYAFLGKFLKGFSGKAVDALEPVYGQLGAYGVCFIATGLMAIPPILLLLLLSRMHRREAVAAAG